MKLFHRLMLGLGIGLFAWLLWQCGPATLWGALVGFGWMIVPFVLLEGVADVFHSWGTRFAFRRGHRGIAILELVRIRLAGGAINYVSPTAGVGGEVIKGALYVRYCPAAEAASALVVDRCAFSIAQLLMATVGGSFILLYVPFPLGFTVGLYVASLLLGGGLVAFLYFQRTGQLQRVAGAVGRLVGRERFAAWAGEPLAEVDGALAAYHRESGWDLWRSTGAHALGFACGIVQAWLFLWTLYHKNAPLDASAIWILGTWFDLAGFMIPAGLGIQEGSRMLVFHALGLTSPVGFAFSLALRLEQVFWTAAGFVLYALDHGPAGGAAVPADGAAVPADASAATVPAADSPAALPAPAPAVGR
ncbi:MAG: flippase-like domain-containing protein [Planctomycetes bacterium]|nr:flippase-like domain-containing protein [Planctomycetota bacterium]